MLINHSCMNKDLVVQLILVSLEVRSLSWEIGFFLKIFPKVILEGLLSGFEGFGLQMSLPLFVC